MQTSVKGTTSLRRTRVLSPICLLFRDSAVITRHASAATKRKTNQAVQLLTDQGQKLGVRKGSGKGQENRTETKYTPVCKYKRFAARSHTTAPGSQ